MRSGKLALQNGFDVSVKEIPRTDEDDANEVKYDADSYILSLQIYQQLESVPFIVWYTKKRLKGATTSELQAEVISEVAEMMLNVTDDNLREMYLDKLSKLVGKMKMWRDAIKRAGRKVKDAENVKAVETKFGAAEAAMRASNADEDVTLAKQRLVDQAGAKDREAAAEGARQKAIRAQINAARREQSRASIDAVELNDNDKTGVLSALGTTMRQLFSGDWGRMAGAKTAEGDAVRKEAEKRAQEAERKAAQLQEQLRASEERQAELRKEAEQLRRKADVKGGEHEAARIERETEESRARRTNAEAARSLADRQEQVAKDQATISGAAGRKAEIQARIDAENARLQAAADRSNKEDRDVYLAQRRLEQADAGNRGKGWKRYAQGARKDLAADVRREEDEAAEAKVSFERTKNAVAETLKTLNEEMRKFEADLKAAQSRMKVNADGGASQ